MTKMLIFAVNDLPLALDLLCEVISAAEPTAEVQGFLHPFDAFNALIMGKHYPCAVFTEIEMSEMNGIELAKKMLREEPWLNIIFVTCSEKHMKEAFAIHASGYLLNPIQPKDIHNEMVHLRTPSAFLPTRRIQIQTFGNFEVRIDGRPVRFKHGKTLEYLAYLVDRGTLCSNKEIEAVLWERNVDSSYVRRLRKDLLDTFHQLGCDNVLLLQRQKQGIRTDGIACDYYDWQKGIPYAIRAYRGEYMSQYSWAEFRHGSLE